MNLALLPGEDASALTAGAEDASGRRYELRAEYVAPVQGFEWMTTVILRLGDDLGDVGDVLVWVSYRGRASNRTKPQRARQRLRLPWMVNPARLPRPMC